MTTKHNFLNANKFGEISTVLGSCGKLIRFEEGKFIRNLKRGLELRNNEAKSTELVMSVVMIIMIIMMLMIMIIIMIMMMMLMTMIMIMIIIMIMMMIMMIIMIMMMIINMMMMTNLFKLRSNMLHN